MGFALAQGYLKNGYLARANFVVVCMNRAAGFQVASTLLQCAADFLVSFVLA